MRGAHTRALVRSGDPVYARPLNVSTDQTTLLLDKLPAVRGDAERDLKKLTPSERCVLYHLVAQIRLQGGRYRRCYGEIAAETNVARRTVIRAAKVLAERGLVLRRDSKNRKGGDAASVWTLGQWLGRLLLSPDRNVTPVPDRVIKKTSEVLPARGFERGGAARPDFFTALRAAFENRALGSACPSVLSHVAKTLPERWQEDALRLAGYTATRAGSSIEAPAAFVRQKLADQMRAFREEPPPSWRVKPTPTAELIRLRDVFQIPQKVRTVVDRPEGGGIIRNRPAPAAPAVAPVGAVATTAGSTGARSNAGTGTGHFVRGDRAPPDPSSSPPRSGAAGFTRPDADWRALLTPQQRRE